MYANANNNIFSITAISHIIFLRENKKTALQFSYLCSDFCSGFVVNFLLQYINTFLYSIIMLVS